MNRIWSLLFIICCLPNSYADELLFNAPVTVTSASKGVFLHIDSSGRRSLAVSGELVAVTWEDNRNGKPAVYVAYNMPGKSGFGKPQKVSKESPAYEPAMTLGAARAQAKAWYQSHKDQLGEP